MSAGFFFGITNVAIGHVFINLSFYKIDFVYELKKIYKQPFDTIKTKMQAEKGFENRSMLNTSLNILKTDGIKGFYKYNFDLDKKCF